VSETGPVTGGPAPGGIESAAEPLQGGGGPGSGEIESTAEEPAVPDEMSAESALPAEASARDQALANAFLLVARTGTGAADRAAQEIESLVSGGVLAARERADREIGSLERIVGPQVSQLAGLARRVIASVRSGLDHPPEVRRHWTWRFAVRGRGDVRATSWARPTA
jgi:hypothetical protein